MLINYNLPTYKVSNTKEYQDKISKNLIKNNRLLMALYYIINNQGDKFKLKRDIDRILSYDKFTLYLDPLNLTYYIACYFAKRNKEKFNIEYSDTLNDNRLFAEGLLYFVPYDEDKETYDYLMSHLKFKSGFAYIAEKLYKLFVG